MADKREQILLRLLALLGTSEVRGGEIDAAHVFRDRAQLGDTQDNMELPALVLLDGSETNLTPQAKGDAVRVMLLTPQIFVVLRPTENGLNEGVGALLSDFRCRIVRAVLRDGELQNLMGIDQRSGYIEYRGAVTDMQTGNTCEGILLMEFAFAYTFNPAKL